MRTGRKVVLIFAIGLNLVTLFLEWNLQFQSMRHPELNIEMSLVTRIEQFAPLFALVVMFWPGNSRPTLTSKATENQPHLT